MIRHVFMWQVADPANKPKVVALLQTLSEQLPTLSSWELAAHEGEPNDNGDPWDGVLISDFDDWRGLQEYSEAPFHHEVVAQLLPLVKSRAVVDFTRED
ncbi:TPA: Dabb family protein [Legionella pneumophila]|nr:Dabb family protein [Legionella pneumophila]